MLAWAQAWPQRTWAIEGAGGLGHLLAQQLLAAGEQVVDVQPKLGARVRLLAAGDTNKNDPNDARSVAVAALRSPARRQVVPDDHAAVLKVWSKRHRDLGRSRTQVVCRLHAVLCELVPGGVSKAITAGHAARLLESVIPSGPVEAARCELTAEFLDDLRRIDAQLREAKKKLDITVRAAGTSLTSIFGVGPVVTATVIGAVGDVTRFPGPRQLVGYLGLDPRVRQSGEKAARPGHISRAGQAHAPGLLVEAVECGAGHRFADVQAGLGGEGGVEQPVEPLAVAAGAGYMLAHLGASQSAFQLVRRR